MGRPPVAALELAAPAEIGEALDQLGDGLCRQKHEADRHEELDRPAEEPARIGRLTLWLVLIATLVSAGNATIRYLFHESSNAWLEIQWYMFSAMFLLASGYTLKHDGHVRVDVLFVNFSPRTKAWVDVFGTIVFLLPAALIILYMSWPFFWNSWIIGERSADAGGLLRWPIKLLVPVGFVLLTAQAVAELIKRLAYLGGRSELESGYQRPSS